MTHVKLPAGYEDWVEVSPEPMGECVKVEVIHWSPMIGGGRGGMPIEKIRYFVPPKPKPVLPDVKPGAVLRYTSKTGKPERAVRNFESWSVYGAGTSGRMNSAGDTGWSLEWSDADLLERVNADGFTVELEGL